MSYHLRAVRTNVPGLVLLCTAIFICFSQACSASAKEVPARPDGYITDLAGMISETTKTRLTETLRKFEADTSNQIVVVTIPNLEGDSLEDFSLRLADQWKIGQAGKDNGVILLISKAERKIRIEVGYGLEGVLGSVDIYDFGR